MRIKGCGGGDAGTNRSQHGDRRDTARAGRSIAVFGAYRDAVARQANETETFRALLCHNNTVTATNEIGIQEARPRDEARVLDGGGANALKQRAVALWYE
jgi:hypothetical protein